MLIVGLIFALALASAWVAWLRTEQAKRRQLAPPKDDISTPHYVTELDPVPKISELERWWDHRNDPPQPRIKPCGVARKHEPHPYYDGSVRCPGVGDYEVRADDQVVSTFRTPKIVLDNGCQCGPGESCTICRYARRKHLHRADCGCYSCAETDGCHCEICQPHYRYPL